MFVAFFMGLSGCAAGAGVNPRFGPPVGAKWGHAAWNRRIACTISGQGSLVRAAPVLIPIADLQKLAADETISLGSLRVVGPKGEIPCQVEECDGAGSPVRSPNHVADSDDRLVFQADVPAEGVVKFFIYWRTEPWPPGRYRKAVEIRGITEPKYFGGDILMRSGTTLVSFRGPARGDDPTANRSENWGAGSLVFCYLEGRPCIKGGWMNYLPCGAIGSRPSHDAARWTRPEPLLVGPVRAAVRSVNARAEAAGLKGGKPVIVRAERFAWLYGHGAWVLVEEFLTFTEPAGACRLEYTVPLRRGGTPGERLSFSLEGKLRNFTPDAAQAEAAKKGKIIFSKAGLDPWMASLGAGRWARFAVVADLGPLLPKERRSVDFYSRTNTTFRLRRNFGAVSAGTRLVHRFWLVGVDNAEGDGVGLAAWRLCTGRPWRLGALERRPSP